MLRCKHGLKFCNLPRGTIEMYYYDILSKFDSTQHAKSLVPPCQPCQRISCCANT